MCAEPRYGFCLKHAYLLMCIEPERLHTGCILLPSICMLFAYYLHMVYAYFYQQVCMFPGNMHKAYFLSHREYRCCFGSMYRRFSLSSFPFFAAGRRSQDRDRNGFPYFSLLFCMYGLWVVMSPRLWCSTLNTTDYKQNWWSRIA